LENLRETFRKTMEIHNPQKGGAESPVGIRVSDVAGVRIQLGAKN